MGINKEPARAELSLEQQMLFELLLQEEELLLEKDTIAPRTDPDYRPLSSFQERLCFIEKLTPGTAFYSTVELLKLVGPLNIALLEKCLNEIIRRHEILRTNFVYVNGIPTQVVAPELRIAVPVVDFQHIPRSVREQRALDAANLETERPFDLEKGPLIRTMLIRLDANEHIAVMTAHHAVFDGWSWGILMEEMVRLYTAFSQGQPSPLPELQLQYADFVSWQQHKFQSSELDRLLIYWTKHLAGSPLTIEVPTDHPRPAIQTFSGDRYSFTLSQSLTKQINHFCQQAEVTQFMVSLAIYKVLLYRYTGQVDILVGFPVWGRSHTELEGLIGCFVNTLVLRTNLAGNPSFHEIVQRVREVVLGAINHQDLPFEKLIEALQPERDLSRSQLMQVMISAVMVNGPSVATLADVQVDSILSNTKTVTCDLELYVLERYDQIHGYFEYNVDLFELRTIQQMARHYQRLFEQMVANPDQRIDDVMLLTETEQHSLLDLYNDTAVAYPKGQCFHDLLKQQAQRVPDAIALVYEDEHITYCELDKRSDQLAHYLKELGVNLEVLVGVCMDRSIDMILGIVSILKAGGAYVPIDPMSPRERFLFTVTETRAPIILTQTWYREMVTAHFDGHILYLDTLDSSVYAQECTETLEYPAHDTNLMYVIYTSGSTGKPKGVQIPHRAIVNFLHSMNDQLKVSNDDTFIGITNLSFDIACLELFLPLSIGARLVLTPKTVPLNGPQLAQALATFDITVMQATPATWRLLVDSGWQSQTKLLALCGGEAFGMSLAKQVMAQTATFWNMYGPTETTVWSAITPLNADAERVTIGPPIANTQIYVLDKTMYPVPIGVPGEIYIGGSGLARGYSHNPVLTAEKFIPHPYSTIAGERLYRTGDIGRYLPNGIIEFLGRADHQVKIRGFRIELDEIGSVLEQHPIVKETVVLVQEDTHKGKYIVAYIVCAHSENEKSGISNVLRDHLKAYLPTYMIPAFFIPLESLPLTRNGKIDYQTLMNYQWQGNDIELEPEALDQALFSPVQRVIAAIWQNSLGLEQVSLHHNFFEVGGHSLLAMQIVASVQNIFQIELPLIEIFNNPTIAGLAEQVEVIGKRERIDVLEIAKTFIELASLTEEEIVATLDEDTDTGALF